MEGFFTWAMLATYAGATVATGLLTQWLKCIFATVPTQIVSYGIALIVLLAATLFTSGLTFESGALCIINAAVVSLASNGAYDAIQRAKGTK
ncbi:MAG: hypothetical protein AAGU74_09555 [Bacillota bacterium]